MSYYPGTETERRVSAAALETLAGKIFERCGMSSDDARLVANSLAWADLRGIHSHGVLRVPEYAEKLLAKSVDPQGRPRVVKDSAAALVIDGGNSMGQIGSVFAMRQALDRARATNVAVAAVRWVEPLRGCGLLCRDGSAGRHGWCGYDQRSAYYGALGRDR